MGDPGEGLGLTTQAVRTSVVPSYIRSLLKLYCMKALG